jgi:transcriptional regulator with XRE-family HTH domain
VPTAADLLIEARGRAALSQAELARRAGVPRSVLNAYERGRREPGVDALARLLAAAGFTLHLAPAHGGVDGQRAARILSDVLDLAEALPFRRAKRLEFPSLLRRTG